MILTDGKEEVKFFEDDIDTSPYDHVLVSVSGGADSALGYYLTCKHFENTDMKIVPMTFWESKRPTNKWYAKDIVEIIKEMFPNTNHGTHEILEYNIYSLTPKLEKKIERGDWDTRVSPSSPQGMRKNFAISHLVEQLVQKYGKAMQVNSLTANPPIEVQEKLDIIHLVETRRNKDNEMLSTQRWKPSPKVSTYKPFIHIDKKFIARQYEKYGLLQTIFPTTSSCVGHHEETEYWTKPCGECFWCYEKMWSFGTYDLDGEPYPFDKIPD